MFGQIEFEEFKGLEKMPQGAASAWSAVEKLVGAKYVPLLYLGRQLVKGVNHFFIAEQTLQTAENARNIVILCVNETGGKYILVPHSVQKIL